MHTSSSLRESGVSALVQPDFSIETLLDSVGNDQAFAAELLELFVTQTPDQLLAIRIAQQANDFVGIGRIIHSQKAPFSVFGLTEVARTGQAAEALIVAEKDAQEIVSMVDKYVTALRLELPVMQSALQLINQ